MAKELIAMAQQQTEMQAAIMAKQQIAMAKHDKMASDIKCLLDARCQTEANAIEGAQQALSECIEDDNYKLLALEELIGSQLKF
jgi:hypothetical protein